MIWVKLMKRVLGLVLICMMVFETACAVTTWSGGSNLESDYGAQKDDETGYWQMKYYVDDFKQPTDEAYLIYTKKIVGTFSNSAVDGKKLVVDIAIDLDKVSFFLYEYGDNLVKGYSSSSTTYAVTMRDSSGKDHNLSATLYANGDRLIFTEISSEKIKDAFAAGGTVSFYIVNNRRKVVTYLFSVTDTTGFTNAWNKLNGIETGSGGTETGSDITAKVVADAVYLRDNAGNTMLMLPVGATVVIMSYLEEKDMFYVKCNGRTGYLKGLGLSVSRDTLLRNFK